MEEFPPATCATSRVNTAVLIATFSYPCCDAKMVRKDL